MYESFVETQGTDVKVGDASAGCCCSGSTWAFFVGRAEGAVLLSFPVSGLVVGRHGRRGAMSRLLVCADFVFVGRRAPAKHDNVIESRCGLSAGSSFSTALARGLLSCWLFAAFSLQSRCCCCCRSCVFLVLMSGRRPAPLPTLSRVAAERSSRRSRQCMSLFVLSHRHYSSFVPLGLYGRAGLWARGGEEVAHPGRQSQQERGGEGDQVNLCDCVVCMIPYPPF